VPFSKLHDTGMTMTPPSARTPTQAGSLSASPLPPELANWLAEHAESLDHGTFDSDALLPVLGQAGLFGIGVPMAQGGSGGDVRDAVEAIAAVAEHSLTAAFVFWGQRAFIEYLLQSPNQALAERWLQPLLTAQHAGATGLSNAMKFLSGIESLQIEACPQADCWRLNGVLHWVTNLRKTGFLVAAAVSRDDGQPPAIVALDSTWTGVVRSDDLDLVALRGSNTAALRIDGVALSGDHVLHADARAFLPAVRPAFLGLQCGMSIGLARAALRSATQSGAARHGLEHEVEALQVRLSSTVQALHEGLADGRFKTAAAPLFRLRIALAEVAQQAVEHELMASGGRAYLQSHGASFARRWREAAFVPIVTPSLSQLRTELARQEATRGLAA
jgi:alkylation response protein AidB-like acyl-CoA dehydrogenase